MSRKRSMRIWSEESIEEYLHLPAAFSTENAGQTPPTQTYLQWIGVITAKCAQTFSLKHMRTKYQRFRKKYMLFTTIKNASGLGWDDEKQIVDCPDWKWDQYCNGNQDIKQLKHGLDHHNMHHAIFGSSLATGNYAVPSSDPYLGSVMVMTITTRSMMTLMLAQWRRVHILGFL